MIPPLALRWDGEALQPHHPKVANKHLVIGQSYRLVEHQDRSHASHGHEFAWLAEAWRSLPDALVNDLPTPEHLRKRALIETGWCDRTEVDAGTRAAALRVAATMQAIDTLALVVTRGPYVVRKVAKSQSYRAMGKVDFQKSKTDVLEWVAKLLDVPAAVLAQQQEAA